MTPLAGSLPLEITRHHALDLGYVRIGRYSNDRDIWEAPDGTRLLCMKGDEPTIVKAPPLKFREYT